MLLPDMQADWEEPRLERNVMGELNMYRQLDVKPNFTEIGRKYGPNRHTVAKYWNSGDESVAERPWSTQRRG